MERRVVDRDLHFGGGEAALAGPRAQEACGEGLATAVLAANPLRHSLAGRDEFELLLRGAHEHVHPGGEVVQPSTRDEAAAQSLDDVFGVSAIHRFPRSAGSYL